MTLEIVTIRRIAKVTLKIKFMEKMRNIIII